MKKILINLFSFGIAFILIINSGCTQKNTDISRGVPVEVTYLYTKCADFSRPYLTLEDTRFHAGNKKNQEIVTRNLIMMDSALNSAESIIQCYENQIDKDKKN